MFNPFSWFFGFLKKEEPKVKAVLVKIEPYLADAVKVTSELSLFVGPISSVALPATILPKVLAFLAKVGATEAKLQDFETMFKTSPINTILHQAAVWALPYVSGKVQILLRDADLAIQTAYNLGQTESTTGSVVTK